MRANLLKRRLAEGRRVCGVLIDVNNADLVELVGHLGFDFALLDAQHGGLNPELARGLLRAADATSMTSLVRVPKNDASVILEYLDAGAGGIIVPNVAERADVDAAASAIKYPPAGRRGASSRSRAAGYGIPQTAAQYYAAANDEVLFLPLIEDLAALDHLDEICSAPGTDVVLAGPGDLSLSMGLPGGVRDPQVLAALERIRATAAKAGKPTMTIAGDAAQGRALYEQGFQGLIVGASALLAGAARDFLDGVKRG
jgi:2-keto-3-deoxy-L-rhamnonate aldolase RhmA